MRQQLIKRLFIGIAGIFVMFWMSTAHAGEDNGFWVSDFQLIAETASSSVEFGVDFPGPYVALNGIKRYARTATSGLGYKAPYSGSGRTQWVAFDFIGSNFFGSSSNASPLIQGGAHMPIFLRAGTFQSSTTMYAVEGKGIFLGRNNSFWGSCGAPESKARIFFETKIVNSGEAIRTQSDQSAGAVKCADWFSDKFFEDGVKYSIAMHVNDTNIAYWIYRADQSGNMVLWSSNGTNALDYPRDVNSFNSGFLDAAWMPTEHSRMNNNNINTLMIAPVLMPTGIGAWNFKISNLNSGNF
jgi:hypothetical protein